MGAREPADVIDAAAARWVARLDRGAGDPRLDEELKAWLAGDTRRRGALLRAQAAWNAFDVERRAAARAPARADGRRRAMAWAAGVAALASGALGWLAMDRPATFSTVKGEREVARLADGSTMLLNTDTRSRVRILKDRRDVALDAGEAWFAVAKDGSRPFVVAAGDVRVEAVGTAFAVRRLHGRAKVVVTEGRVRVWSARQPARFVMLGAGHRATISDVVGPKQADVRSGGLAEALAWRNGEIVLNEMTLGQAAAEFNRYNRRQLSIDATLADERLVGRFRATEIDSFAASAAAMTGARVERDDGLIRLVR